MPQKSLGQPASPVAIGAALVAFGSGLVALINWKNLSLLLVLAVIFFVALVVLFVVLAEIFGRNG